MEPIVEDLLHVVSEFSSFGAGKDFNINNPTLDSRNTIKIFKDSGLFSRRLTKTDIDITFLKVKPKSQTRIDFHQFLELLRLLEAKTGIGFETMVERIVHSRGPQFNHATMTHYTKFHDDKSLYTGVHTHGGPTNVDKKITLSNLADRSPSDVRGVKLDDYESNKVKHHHRAIVHEDELHGHSKFEQIHTVPSQSHNSPTYQGGRVAPTQEMGNDQLKIYFPGDLHPDYYPVKNPNAKGNKDAFYFVNRLTNEATWEKIVVPPPPPPMDTSTIERKQNE